MWATIDSKFPKSDVERLELEAEALEREAARLREGVSFYGEHPALRLERDANDKRRLAEFLKAKKAVK